MPPFAAQIAGFLTFRSGHETLLIRQELADKASVILKAIHSLRQGRIGVGNRCSGFELSLEGAPELFVRLARRGGLIRYLASDLYIGFHPRVFRELDIALKALARGIPVATPMGAVVETVAPGLYRAAMITRAMHGKTLWDLFCTECNHACIEDVLEQARIAIASMHRGGLSHADLNLHNLFVTAETHDPRVIILDLDKARFYASPLPNRLRRKHLARLMRSARKLDPQSRVIDAQTLAILTGD